jgi:hypothetical protein
MAGPIQIVIVGGDFVACAARRAWNAACGRRCRGHGGQTPRTACCTRRCRLGGVGPGRTPPRGRAAAAGAAPRASAWARSPNIDLDLRTCTYRRPSGDEQVLSWDRLVFAPGSVSRRLVPFRAWPSTPADAANLGRRLRVGLDWAVAVAMPRAIVELGSLGRTGPLAAKGAGR